MGLCSEETGKERQNDLKSDVQDPFSVQWKKFDEEETRRIIEAATRPRTGSSTRTHPAIVDGRTSLSNARGPKAMAP